MEKAEQWFIRATQAGSSHAEYALGKLGRSEEGLRWLDRAASHGNAWSMLRSGGERRSER